MTIDTVAAILESIDLERDKWDDYTDETKDAVSRFVAEHDGKDLIGIVLDASDNSTEPYRVARLLEILVFFPGPKQRAISDDFGRRFDAKDSRFMRFHSLIDFSSSLPELTRDEIIGRRLICILQRFEVDVGSFDTAFSFFVLDNNVAFCLPDVDSDGLITAKIEEGAERIEGPNVADVYGQTIVDILSEPADSEISVTSPYLILANGYAVNDKVVAPHGTGGAGVYIFEPKELDKSRLVSYPRKTPAD